MEKSVWILGIWDGHDAGAVLLNQNEVVFAINEERLSRRKLEVGFPIKSIRACLEYANLQPDDVNYIAYTTSDFAKTLTRFLPGLAERYYQIRRRKLKPNTTNRISKAAKYILTQIPPNIVTKKLSDYLVAKQFQQLGFKNFDLSCYDHHQCHASAAAFSSPYPEGVAITLDGLGDGASGSVWRFNRQNMTCIQRIKASDSFGIFFEHVTNILGLRELEDEGKVMALANFSTAVPDQKNPLLKVFAVEGLLVKSRISGLKLKAWLIEQLWYVTPEKFAFMAQRVLESHVLQFFRNVRAQFPDLPIVFSGGVAANVKLNMLIDRIITKDQFMVFPHMGDGGLALGAAFLKSREISGKETRYSLKNLYLGSPLNVSRDLIQTYCKRGEKIYEYSDADLVIKCAEALQQGKIVFWNQGRMEYGPRALGARSILAAAHSLDIKDSLNLRLKKRVWYQPFCPVILEEDAASLLTNYSTLQPHMTCAYQVALEARHELIGATNIDGTCRPQILSSANSTKYALLLKEYRRISGRRALINTSLNIHGEPLVCTAEDALRTFAESDVDILVIENYFVERTGDRS